MGSARGDSSLTRIDFFPLFLALSFFCSFEVVYHSPFRNPFVSALPPRHFSTTLSAHAASSFHERISSSSACLSLLFIILFGTRVNNTLKTPSELRLSRRLRRLALTSV